MPEGHAGSHMSRTEGGHPLTCLITRFTRQSYLIRHLAYICVGIEITNLRTQKHENETCKLKSFLTKYVRSLTGCATLGKGQGGWVLRLLERPPARLSVQAFRGEVLGFKVKLVSCSYSACKRGHLGFVHSCKVLTFLFWTKNRLKTAFFIFTSLPYKKREKNGSFLFELRKFRDL